jgi:hypothetical protein
MGVASEYPCYPLDVRVRTKCHYIMYCSPKHSPKHSPIAHQMRRPCLPGPAHLEAMLTKPAILRSICDAYPDEDPPVPGSHTPRAKRSRTGLQEAGKSLHLRCRIRDSLPWNAPRGACRAQPALHFAFGLSRSLQRGVSCASQVAPGDDPAHRVGRQRAAPCGRMTDAVALPWQGLSLAFFVHRRYHNHAN